MSPKSEEFDTFLEGLSCLPKSSQKRTILKDYENGVLTPALVEYAFFRLGLEEA